MANKRCSFRADVHILLHRNDQLLFLRRANTGYADGQYSLPAGHLDGRETVLGAARREAREETGLDLPFDTLRIVQVMHRAAETADDNEHLSYFVLATGWSGEPTNTEPAKCDDLRWAPIAAPPKPTVPYIAAAIAAWQADQPFTGFGWSEGDR